MNPSGPKLTIQTFLNPFEIYTDARTHGYDGPSRRARIGRVTPQGGGTIAANGDGSRVAVTGKECLRILRVHDSAADASGGPPRIDVSRNFWDGSGLKIDSASTDIAWGHGLFNNKLLTSARNGELIQWDINKSGNAKYERRSKDHIRSIHKIAVSARVDSYCITGSADGDMRVWDLRDISKSIMRIHHPTSVRSVVFSPSAWQPLEAVVGLDNGSLYRWDLRYGQRGQLDKLPVAHTASVTALDWCYPGTQTGNDANKGMGWLVSGGLDRTVKVWDLSSPVAKAHIPHKPTYTLHPSYAVRRIAWRPGYECELAIVTNVDYPMSVSDHLQPVAPEGKQGLLTRVSSGLGLDSLMKGVGHDKGHGLGVPVANSHSTETNTFASLGDAVEIWDVRREWLAKWSVTGSANDGGVTDLHFKDSHGLWTQNSSGAFVQLDLREATKPIDAIPRVSATWDAAGSLGFIVDDSSLNHGEVPYDDVITSKREPVELRKGQRDQQQQQSKYKALGDPVVRLMTQTIATLRPTADFDDSTIDLDTFTNLARRYIIEGRSKSEICAFNAGVAFSAGHDSAAQFWLLLGACTSYLVPKPSSTGKKVPVPLAPPEPYNPSHPPPQTSATMGNYSFPGPSSPRSAVVSPGVKTTQLPQHYSGTPKSRKNTGDGSSATPSRFPSFGPTTSKSSEALMQSRSLSHYGTPASSAKSSPRHLPPGLPPIGPRRASVFDRRHSINVAALDRGSLRRPSLPASHVHSGNMVSLASSPSERTSSFAISSSVASSSHVSARNENIGEGALDDSDSDSHSEEDDGDEESFDDDVGFEDGNSSSSDDAATTAVSVQRSRSSFVNPRSFTAPSPLSRVASRESWTEDDGEEEDDTEVPIRVPLRHHDDDDGYVPSSQPSDGDSESSDDGALASNVVISSTGRIPPSPRVVRPRNQRNRSRSSTVASLPAPQAPALVRQESDSSTRTVTASLGSMGVAPAGRHEGRTHWEPTASSRQRSLERVAPQMPTHVPGSGHRRTHSRAISEHMSGGGNSATRSVSNAPSRQPSAKPKDPVIYRSPPDTPQISERRIEYISADEKRFRETTLVALREALEEFCEQGDVQMCAMVALVAPSDLKITPIRVTRFLDSYLEILSRLRLHACAAYVRKYCKTEDIFKLTLVETTIYTSCGKCRKPLMLPAGSFKAGAIAKGAFSYCLACKVSPMKCSICRLPVRSLLFQCSVCHHGGHQACYREFYLQNEMRNLPSKGPSDTRGRTWLRAASGTSGSSLSVLTDSSGTTGPSVSTDDDESSSTISGTSTEAASAAPGSTATHTPGNSTYQSPVARKHQPLFGHPCAAGCGHFCWAANANPEI